MYSSSCVHWSPRPPLLCRAEAERLQLQQQAAGLADHKQRLESDVLKLQQQLAEAHAACTNSQQQIQDLTTARDKLQVQVGTAQLMLLNTYLLGPCGECITVCFLLPQVKSAVTEYRANAIIAIGLRDQITRLQQELSSSQHVCSEQVGSSTAAASVSHWPCSPDCTVL